NHDLGHGDVVIAAITSCTNTSNPSVMVAAGLLAKKAVERGLKVKPWVKTSLAPGSQGVAEYYEKSGLQKAPHALGFNLVRFGRPQRQGHSGPVAAGDSRGDQGERSRRRRRAAGQPKFRGPRQRRRPGELPCLPAAGGRLCDRGLDERRCRQGGARHRQEG